MDQGFCVACGVEVAPASVYCHRCGHRLDEPATGRRQFNPASAESGEQPGTAGEPVRQPAGASGPADRTGDDRRDRMKSRGPIHDPPEEVLWCGSYSFKALMPAVLGLGLLSLVSLVAAGIYLWDYLWIVAAVLLVPWCLLPLRYAYMRLNHKYRLTTQRFKHEEGILRRITDRIEVIEINDVTIEQGLIDRFFQVGKIHLTSSDRTHPQLTLLGIAQVREVGHSFDRARRQERLRRGLHIETM